MKLAKDIIIINEHPFLNNGGQLDTLIIIIIFIMVQNETQNPILTND